MKIVRRKIDRIDDKISRLLDERRALVTEIARYKKSKGLEIFDDEREMEVLKKANVYDGGVFRAILDSSKDFQAGIINAGTFGLICQKEIKSLSPLVHSFWGDYEYRLCPTSENALPDLLKNLAYDGFNVTMPYKKTVFKMCDQLSPECYPLGNVNTVKREIDGSLTGYNTDYFGFQYILENNDIDVAGKKAVILGTGGAAETCKAVLNNLGAANVYMISRTGEFNYENLDRHKDAEIIVNATPVGMYPYNGDKPIELNRFDKLEAVVDLIYNPYKTALLLEAEELGIKAVTGLEMLVAQAGKAAEIFCKGNLEEGDIEAVIEKVQTRVFNRCIIGPEGSGKTFMGRRIANVQNLKFVDVEKSFYGRHGLRKNDYINQFGKDRYLVMEHALIQEITKNNGQVIALSSSVMENPENRNLLKQNGVIIDIKKDGMDSTAYEQWADFDIVNNVEFKKSFLVLNGPNLNLLGSREPNIYGEESYSDLVKFLEGVAEEMNININVFQSNHEGELVDKIQEAASLYDGIVLNPAGYGYTSVAILDALKAVDLPMVEVHISDISKREEFREVTLTSQCAKEVISGLGFEGYQKALEILKDR